MKELYDHNSEKVAAFVQEFFADEQRYKEGWAKQARTWVAFANGDQNPYPNAAPVMVNNNPANFSQQSDTRQNMYAGDELEAIIRTLVSYLTRQQPTVDVDPIDQDEQSKNIARVSRRVLEAKYQIDNEQENSRKVANDLLVYGTVFAKDYWDYSKGAYVLSTDELGNPELDEAGSEIYSKTGNNAVNILNPLLISVDHSVTNFDEQPLIVESCVVDVGWSKEVYDRNEPGYTGLVDKIKEESVSASTLRINEELKFAIPYLTQGAQYRTKGQTVSQQVYIRPNKTYPRGRMLIIVGGVVVYDSKELGECPYFLEQEETIWHPYNCIKYEEFIGRFIGKSLIEGLIPLQMRLNEINGAILENANTLAKPNICAAIGQLKKGVVNGKGANVYNYQVTAGAPAPFILPGTALPSQFFTERQQIIEQMVRKAGTNMAMQGQPPPGVTAAAAIQQLLENANSQQSALMQNFAKFHEKRFTKKLRFIHKFMEYPDPVLEKYLKQLNKDFLNEQVSDFVGARDLSDGVMVKIEFSSMIPKSEAARTQAYLDIAKQGGLGPALAEDSPRGEKIRTQLLEKLHLEPLESEEAIELKKAKWENERIVKGAPVQVSPYDVAAVHLPCHKSKIQDPLFLENATPEQFNALNSHIQEHEAIEQQQALMRQTPPTEQMPQGGQAPEINSVMM